MVVIGVVLIAIGVVLLVGGIFGTSIESELDANRVETTVTFFGFNADPTTLFILGMVAMGTILVGLWTVKFGTKRAWALRKERKVTEKRHRGTEKKAATAEAASPQETDDDRGMPPGSR